nr:zinc ribbon domain-containing protein [Corallococcus macrosporus]
MIDVLQKISDPAPATCGACGAEGSMQKVVSRSSFVLKGGGWYSDLYSSTKKDGGSSSSSSSSGASSSSSASTSASSAPSTPAPAPAAAAASDKK